MEQIIKNADTFLHVLEAAHSSRVASWQTANLTKSLSWADHHQKVYQSYREREKIRCGLDIEFKKLAYRNCILVNAFGFEFMRNCKDFLVGVLKNNSSLSQELSNCVPQPETQIKSTQIFNCLININKTLNRDDKYKYVTDVMDAICDTVNEAVTFQQNCPVLTTAPQRAITTLLTRVYNITKTHELFLICFVHGKETVRQSIVEWLDKFDPDVWSVSDVKHLTKCSALHPGFCKLHIRHIVKLFSLSYGYKSQHLDLLSDINESSSQMNIPCEDLQNTKDQIFGSTSDTSSPNKGTLVDLSKHLILLHATPCYLIVEELLLTLSKHQNYGLLAQTYVDFLTKK